jgi:phage/plasmid-like protein (TIGR03299 family)
MSEKLYQDTMAFTGAIPWHAKGFKFDREFTSAEAIEAAHLDYPVVKEPVYRMVGGMPVQVDHRFVTVNGVTQDVLGFVGDDYRVLQNKDAFAPFDILMEESGAKFQTAGALGLGEKVWILAKLPESWDILLGDKIDLFCLLSTSHDGSTGVEIRFTPIRVVCQNTLTAAVKGTRASVSLRHTENLQARLKESAEVLVQMRNHFNLLGESFREMASVHINDEWLKTYEDQLFGLEPKQDAHGITKSLWMKRTDAYHQRLVAGRGVELPGLAGSAWWAYNAAIEYADYEFPIRDEARRTESILWGKANAFKQTAYDSAMALVRR